MRLVCRPLGALAILLVCRLCGLCGCLPSDASPTVRQPLEVRRSGNVGVDSDDDDRLPDGTPVEDDDPPVSQAEISSGAEVSPSGKRGKAPSGPLRVGSQEWHRAGGLQRSLHSLHGEHGMMRRESGGAPAAAPLAQAPAPVPGPIPKRNAPPPPRTGPRGAPGIVIYGAFGPSGPTGNQGPRGPRGPPGMKGQSGGNAVGLAGSVGAVGPPGAPGDQGRKGPQGVAGPPGLVAEAPVLAEVLEEDISSGDRKIGAIEDTAKSKWKSLNEEIVRMYGQVAIFKDKTERLGTDIGKLNQTMAQNSKTLKDSSRTTKQVEIELNKQNLNKKAAQDELKDMQVLTMAKSNLEGLEEGSATFEEASDGDSGEKKKIPIVRYARKSGKNRVVKSGASQVSLGSLSVVVALAAVALK